MADTAPNYPNSGRVRFFATAIVAASIASVVVGAMEMYVSTPTNVADPDRSSRTAPSSAEALENKTAVEL